MIRVIYILNATDKFGGATKAIMNLVNGLDGIQPYFILPEDSGIAETLREKGCAYSVLNYRMCVYPPLESWRDYLLFLPRLMGRIYLNRRAAKQVAAIAENFHAAIIHTNTSVNDIGYQASRILHLPHVWHIREYGVRDFGYHHYPCRAAQLKKYKNQQSYTICITKDIQEYNELQQWANSHVIYDGVLHENQADLNLSKKDYLLFAGRLEEGKGIEELLHAYSVYAAKSERPAPLWVAGDTRETEYKSKLLQITEQDGIKDNVLFLSMRPDILELMRDALALVVPSRSEGFGFITAEGMFSGALVIGKDVSGTKEQFDNGYRLTNQDIALKYLTENELVEHLCTVTRHGIKQYVPMIKAGQSVVKQLYSIEHHKEAVYQFYCEILNQREK